ncbi:MAG TPA: UDP-N-acetylglucosamine 2-epimerase (non-hydrolyzing) [Bacteroidales bacterium]|nr:UDP-N-acetylglucosamine 2-epimerase (non-hydrolyzing) [Bacteroidales bacterium]
MKIINIVGARPNLMKIAPILEAMKSSPFIEPILLHTGQHYDDRMSGAFFRELSIPEPDIYLEVGSASHAKQVAKIMERFDDVCDALTPDAILVVGDVNSTLACSLVAAKKDIYVIHVEAGIRSFDKTMPEEINRILTDAVSDLLLTPTNDAVQNLLNEGHSEDKIRLVGNIMIDTLKKSQAMINASRILENLGIVKHNYVAMTMHRPSNVDSLDAFRNILSAIAHIQTKIKVVFPIHPRTRKMMSEFGLQDYFDSLKNIIITEPLGYFDFGKLISNAKFVITDSGGIQEETTVYGVPCITIRNSTERPVTVTEGTNELAGNDTALIIELAERILAGNWKKGKIPELWDGLTARRIVAAIEEKLT